MALTILFGMTLLLSLPTAAPLSSSSVPPEPERSFGREDSSLALDPQVGTDPYARMPGPVQPGMTGSN